MQIRMERQPVNCNQLNPISPGATLGP